MKDKVIIAEKTQRLIEMTAGFCDEYASIILLAHGLCSAQILLLPKPQ